MDNPVKKSTELLSRTVTGEIMMKNVEVTIGGRTISIETGKLAKQASGSVVVRSGDTVVLVTAVGDKTNKPELGFLPLTIEYQEKLASVGRIPGNYFRREIGRPSESEVLTCRIIDRPLRPLFADGLLCRNPGYRFSALCGSGYMTLMSWRSPAQVVHLMLSDIPFDGPVAGGRVGYIDGQYVMNPGASELEKSALDIVVACTEKAVVMVEGKADTLARRYCTRGNFSRL